MKTRRVSQAPEPMRVFERMNARAGFFFLDSAMPGTLGQYSFMGWEPYRTVRQRGLRMEDHTGDRRRIRRVNPFAALKELMPQVRDETPEMPTPFASGAVGYLGYELNHFVERIGHRARRDETLPDMYFGFYDAVLGYDHTTGECWATASRPGASEREEQSALDRMLRKLDETAEATPAQVEPASAWIKPGSLKSNFARDAYLRALERTIEYIAAGDIFQANLSQRFEAEPIAEGSELYRRLRTVNPAPFGAYLALGGGCAVLSSSPERFLQVNGRRVETRPIKGTRPRTGNEPHDERMRRELVASAKDNAELAMIVDLERNDLGRVCTYGSIDVTERCALETYATVYHLVATVVGELHAEHDMSDLLRATFPGGSITGAPKVRAMEIIDELEPTARGVYTGAIGWFDDRGGADLNIAIRTMTLEPGRAAFQAGGGIVADSVPEQEYEETLDKARALMHALGVNEDGAIAPGGKTVKIWFDGNVVEETKPVLTATDRGALFGDALFETFRTYGGKPFRLERHLARMADSGAFFRLKLPYPAEEIHKAVKELLTANKMGDAAVRITMTRGAVAGPLGLAESTRENVFMTLRNAGYPEEQYHEGMRLMVATVRRNSFSTVSRHKTANYLDALVARQEATDAGADEALMLDETGAVAECTTANVFAVRDGVVWTPALEAPILPGVTRAIVLEICRELGQSVREGSMELEELAGADEAFITNSVMEIMPVRMVTGKPVGTGRPGPVYQRIREAYRKLVQKECGA